MSEGDMPPDAAEIGVHERLGEEAYDRMYDARGRDAKDFCDDACSHLFAAAKIADALGLEAEAARLNARRVHIRAVYNSQFRSLF
jgi:hypothetical protein